MSEGASNSVEKEDLNTEGQEVKAMRLSIKVIRTIKRLKFEDYILMLIFALGGWGVWNNLLSEENSVLGSIIVIFAYLIYKYKRKY